MERQAADAPFERGPFAVIAVASRFRAVGKQDCMSLELDMEIVEGENITVQDNGCAVDQLADRDQSPFEQEGVAGGDPQVLSGAPIGRGSPSLVPRNLEVLDRTGRA